jgi:hypothetical protein
LIWAFYGLVFLLMGCQTAEVDTFLYASGPPTCQNLDELEKAKGLAYDFFKYSALNKDVEDAVVEIMRQEGWDIYQAYAAEVEGMTLPQALAYFNNEGIATPGIWQELHGYYHGMKAAINKPVLDFGGLQADLDALITSTKSDSGLSCYEKSSLIFIYHLTKGVFLYLEEAYAPALASEAEGIELRSDCNEIDCFFETFVENLLQGAAAGATKGGILGGLAGALAGLADGALAGAISGIIKGLWNWGDDCCDIDCFPIRGVSLFFPSCDPAARYTAFGFGSDAVSLLWANREGMPETAITPAAIPRLTVSQNSSSLPVRTTVFTNCNNGTSVSILDDPIVRDLFHLSLSTAGVGTWGPRRVVAGTTHDYGIFGVMSSSVVVTEWLVSNGTIIQNNGTWIRVQWDAGMENGMVQAEVSNTCPGGQVSWHTINVTADPGGDIP